jgi:exopolysaccharide biosynthesis protein
VNALLLLLGVIWHAVRPGIWQSEFPLERTGALSVVRVTLIRIDPKQVTFQLERLSRDYGMTAAWTIDSISDDAVVAFNAGQFIGGIPWGWVVRDGVEAKPPGAGRLAMAFVVDSMGGAMLVSPDELPNVRTRAWLGFQSYPALLIGAGEMPWELQAQGRGVNLQHRDSRLALGVMADGSIVIALTRFGGAGRVGETLPFGPTVPEMASLMRSLGCERAMLLDGGISSQLAVREMSGGLRRWANWRAVPLALIARPRTGAAMSGGVLPR